MKFGRGERIVRYGSAFFTERCLLCFFCSPWKTLKDQTNLNQFSINAIEKKPDTDSLKAKMFINYY